MQTPALCLSKAKRFFQHPFWSSWRTITVVYALIPVIIGLLKWHKENDTYLIYKSVFWNTVNQLPLYEFYDYLKGDSNHYGVIFSYVIAAATTPCPSRLTAARRLTRACG